MRAIILTILCVALLLPLPTAHADGDDDLFTGNKRSACEALLCLSSSHRPSECNSAIRKYYSIKRYTSKGSFSPSKTRSARKSFLAMCPSGDNATVSSLSNTLGNVLNQCDAETLNSRKVYYARAFDVLAATWSEWKLLGRNNSDVQGRSNYRFEKRQFPACTSRQLSYAKNLAVGKEQEPSTTDGYTSYPIPTTCYESKELVDPSAPEDCDGLFRSTYTDYRLEYKNGLWTTKN